MLIYSGLCLIWCLLARIRTWDPLIKSQLLYQLSYEEVWGCKDRNFSEMVYPFNGKKMVLHTVAYGCRKACRGFGDKNSPNNFIYLFLFS